MIQSSLVRYSMPNNVVKNQNRFSYSQFSEISESQSNNSRKISNINSNNNNNNNTNTKNMDKFNPYRSSYFSNKSSNRF